MKRLGLSITLLVALPRLGITQAIARSALVGSWKGKEVHGNSGPTFVLVMNADSSYTKTSDSLRFKPKPRYWAISGDTIRFSGHRYRVQLRQGGQEFTLWELRDTTTAGTFRYQRVGTPIP